VKSAAPANPPAARRTRRSAAPVRFALLPTFRLETLATITAKHGEMLYQRHFGMRMDECRLLGVVLAYEPVSLRRACVELGMDKSMGSRLVARHVRSGLLERRDDPVDQRSFYLVLSAAGRELITRINAVAVARNRDWLAGLPPAERDAFLAHIDRQIAHARELLDREMRRAKRAPPPAPSHERGGVSSREPGPVLVEREALADVHRRLGELLEQSSGARK
jgi:DNA-binding MarR family transcriptional regulator